MAPESVPTNPVLSTLALGGFDDAALNIATYLCARDILTLHKVNHGWNTLLNKHDEVLFERLILIHQDFVEGYVLNYVAKRDKLSYKKLYLAFHNKWSLPKFGSEKNSTKPKKRNKLPEVTITWQPGYINRNDIDIKSVVFIGRLGSYDGDNALYEDDPDDIDKSCILLQWNKEYVEQQAGANNYKLVIDKGWKNETDGFYMNQNTNANMAYLENDDFEELEKALKLTHTLTLHAIDIRQYQVATLMEDSQMSSLIGSEGDTLTMKGYGFGMPILCGIPQKNSPFYHNPLKRDYLSIRGDIECEHYTGVTVDDNGVEIEGSRHLYVDLKQGEGEEGIKFNFGSRPPHEVCSFLKAVMEKKCVVGERRLIFETSAIVTQQPDWIQHERVVDTITSYASFEDQAGDLRLVCRQFGKSALKQLRTKLDKTEQICVSGGMHTDFFKATIRNGWSEACLTSKERAVEDAIWLLKCRCGPNLCGDRESCPNKDKPLQYTRINGETKSVSKMQFIRETLVKESSYRVSQGGFIKVSPCVAEYSLKQEALSIYEIGDIVHACVKNHGRMKTKHSGCQSASQQSDLSDLSSWHLLYLATQKQPP